MNARRRELAKRLRWRLIYWVDKVVPSQCWADLVPWALYGPRDRGKWLPLYSDRSCRRYLTEEPGYCYCGKYQANRGEVDR
jgi:hypothetical protein